MHKLIDVKFNLNEKKRLRKWSGVCKCNRWQGAGPSEKELNKLWKNTHLKESI